MSDVPKDAPSPASDRTSDERLRARVDELLARPAATTRGQVTVDGKALDYTAQVAFVPVPGDGFDAAASPPQAAVMTTSYQLDNASPADRPVCFAFNGGPGSASLWLHLGALGPQRIATPDDGSLAPPPYAVEDNPHSWFGDFDLVFVDPPHTGWSVCAGEAARKKMLSVDGDVQALADAIRAWLTQHRRWGSRVYIAGESYGSTRAAALADRLQADGVLLSGVILVSCAIDLQSIVFAPSNDLPYALFLPAFAGVAQFHGLLQGPIAASPDAARAAAEAFVADDYVAVLHAGARLDGRRRQRVARRIAELTGLPATLVDEKNLRIDDRTFFVEALRGRGRVVGRLDARATAPAAVRRTGDMEFDPGIEAIAAPYTMAAMAYFTEILGVDLRERYETLSLATHEAWNWNRGKSQGNDYASTSPDLARALRRNPQLKVLVASGRYDLGTPYSATDWSLARLDVPADVATRVQHRYYDAGHMMYTRNADAAQLRSDVAEWLRCP